MGDAQPLLAATAAIAAEKPATLSLSRPVLALHSDPHDPDDVVHVKGVLPIQASPTAGVGLLGRRLAEGLLFGATIWFDSMRPIVLVWAKGGADAYTFRLSTWVLCSKAGVFLATCLLFAHDHCTGGSGRPTQLLPLGDRLRLSLLLLIPSLAYVASDILTFPVLELTTAATFSVLRQSKLLVTAVLCRFVLGRAVSGLQWFAILQLLLASVLFVSEALEGSTDAKVSCEGQLLGLFLLACKIFCDAFAATSQDVLFKRLSEAGVPFSEQQVACALYMLLVSMGTCGYQDGAALLQGGAFFDAYNIWAFLAIVHYAVYGVLVMLFLRYLDCMLKMLESTGSVALTIVWDVAFLGAVVGTVQWIAAALVVLASGLYLAGGRRPPTEADAARAFAVADRDGDGVLTPAEFRRWYVDPHRGGQWAETAR
eukprot:EG_transcript_10782